MITEAIEEATPWAMPFADELVLCDPARVMMKVRLERLIECMEQGKTEHIQGTHIGLG